MFQIYRGYSIGPGHDDPGWLIRLTPNGQVVGMAANMPAAQAWVDLDIANNPNPNIRRR
jgi:hypothetical protein